jgi:putative FmdB family regulatory protein
MPTYEYKCENCSAQFELFQSITDEPLKQCPTCSGRVERLIGTGGGFIFKGSGFYITDYRSESYKKAEKAEKPDTSQKDSPSKHEKETSPKISTEK